jgi:hypothetical protein
MSILLSIRTGERGHPGRKINTNPRLAGKGRETMKFIVATEDMILGLGDTLEAAWEQADQGEDEQYGNVRNWPNIRTYTVGPRLAEYIDEGGGNWPPNFRQNWEHPDFDVELLPEEE